MSLGDLFSQLAKAFNEWDSSPKDNSKAEVKRLQKLKNLLSRMSIRIEMMLSKISK